MKTKLLGNEKEWFASRTMRNQEMHKNCETKKCKKTKRDTFQMQKMQEMLLFSEFQVKLVLYWIQVENADLYWIQVENAENDEKPSREPS